MEWICKNYAQLSGRHAGDAPVLPPSCPYCGKGVEIRTHCACGYPIDDCSQGRCTSPLAGRD